MITVGINGFGRIGRSFLRLAYNNPDIRIVAINDLGDIENFGYLLKYDTAQGKAEFDVSVRAGEKPALIVGGEEILYLSEREPKNLPWGKLGVDVVVESTGFFATYEASRAHIEAGAKRVVISAPVKGDGSAAGETVLMGINEEALGICDISSNASCTTNSAAAIMQVLHEKIGIEKAMLNTVHAYTSTQELVDAPGGKKDMRRGRAAAQNIIPSSTGAAVAVTQVLTDLSGKFDGIALRVPVISGSIADVTFISKRNTTVEEVNQVLSEAAASEEWKSIFAVTDEPLVSSDIVGSTYAGIVDLLMTRVVDGNLVKVMSWYDNEMGYTATLIDHVIKAGSSLKA